MQSLGNSKLVPAVSLRRGRTSIQGTAVVVALVFVGVLLIITAGPNATRMSARAQGPSAPGATPTNPCSTSSIFKPTGPISPHAPLAASSVAAPTLHGPASAPPYFEEVYQSALRAALPDKVYNDGGVPPVVPASEIDPDPAGCTASYQPGGAVTTASNAFFQSLGTNGRSCITCHQPPSGMSVSLQNINDRFNAPNGQHDPIFAPIDGADCPDLVPVASTSGAPVGGRTGKGTGDFKSAHHLLLTRGLFRIFLPVPAGADYTISVVSDPYGCNTNPAYNQTTTGGQLISVYRRPLISGNLAFVTMTRADTGNSPTTTTTQGTQTVTAAVDPVTGLPICVKGNATQAVCVDPITGKPISGNVMWDGREPDLEQQAIDATFGHAQALQPGPTPAQVQQIVAFENGIYNAQIYRKQAAQAVDLASAGGGPKALYGYVPYAGIPSPVFPPNTTFTPTFFLYDAWQNASAALRASIYRGQQIFNGSTLPDGTSRGFTVSNVAGLNNIATSPGHTLGPRTGSCSICHNQTSASSDSFPAAQHDLGIGGDSSTFGGPVPNAAPYAKDLPVFQVTCKSGSTMPFHGTSVQTTDPGLALITGKCADVGRFTVAQLRALASHAPYFSDGSAATLIDVVNFYNNRFSINLSAQDKQDLVNFLNSL
jgi:cytochrome c peroxidase